MTLDDLPAGVLEELLALQALYEDALAALLAHDDEVKALRERHRQEVAPFVRVRDTSCEKALHRFEQARPEDGGPTVALLQRELDLATGLARGSFDVRTREADFRHSRSLAELARKTEGLQTACSDALRKLRERMAQALAAPPNGAATKTASLPGATAPSNGESGVESPGTILDGVVPQANPV